MADLRTPKKLEDLTEEEFTTLKNAGILSAIYSDAPENYDLIRKMKPAMPQQLSSPDFSEVIPLCKEYIKAITDGARSEDNLEDLKGYIFEAAMESVYGIDVWNYVNAKLR